MILAMMNFITALSRRNIHDEKIAVVRTLLAVGTLVTIVFNDIHLLTNLSYLYDLKSLPLMREKLFGLNIGLFTVFNVTTAKVISILVLLSVISGYLPQLTCLLHVWVTLSVTNCFVPVDGGDQIAADLSLLLVPLCITDSRLNQWSSPRGNGNPYINIFSNVTKFFICLQAAIVYLHAGVGKLNADAWKDGTASYYWFSHATNGAPDWLRKIYEWVTLSQWVSLLSWSIILFELLLFACLFANKRVKGIFLVLGILFHFFIILTHGLLSFFFSMTALLVIYLDDQDRSIGLVTALKKRIHYERTPLYGKL
jgi:antimicrobial peptide system SdpB family protein